MQDIIQKKLMINSVECFGEVDCNQNGAVAGFLPIQVTGDVMVNFLKCGHC